MFYIASDSVAISVNDGGRHQLHVDQYPEGDRLIRLACESISAGAAGKSIMIDLDKAIEAKG